MAQENLKYKRVIIKLSGEALAGANGTGIDPEFDLDSLKYDRVSMPKSSLTFARKSQT